MFYFILLLVIVIGVVLMGYNKLRALSENLKESWSNIGVILRTQNSLVTQLIEVAKDYQENEKLITFKVSEDMSVGAVSQAYQQQGAVLATVAGVAQRFPELKSNEQYNNLMQSLNKLEDELSLKRGQYNSAAKQYNVQRTSIPHVFYSTSLGFKPAPYLNLDADTKDFVDLDVAISDDGERLNALLAGASGRVINAGKEMSSKAIETGKNIVDKSQEQIKQLKNSEKTQKDE